MYETILAAVDESETAERVLAAAQELATVANAEVHVLHVWEAEPSKNMACTTPSYEDAHMLVKAATAKLSAAGIRSTGEVAANLYSHTAREITSYAKSHDVAVIVIGSRRRSDLTALLTARTSHKVVQLADCPVVVVP